MATPGRCNLGLAKNIEDDLLNMAGHGLALRTWAGYRTAERMLAMYLHENKQPLELPVEQSTIAGFVHWLIYKRKVKSGTINSYLAGIRMLHIMKGSPAPVIRTELLQLILTGKSNKEAGARLRGETGRERQPVTLEVLRLIKSKIRLSNNQPKDKLTLWAACTIMFHGGFRGAELLSTSRKEFDPAFTLLKKDVRLVGGEKQMLQVTIKMPKEDKDGRASIVDIYPSDNDICPIRAAQKWLTATRSWETNQPAFRWEEGSPLTTADLNNQLTKWLKNYGLDRIRVHSFRCGLASMMATSGYSDEEIKAMGRWSSRAYENYIKLPRQARARVARKVAKKK